MTIQMAVLCDAATDYNGKLNVLGTFDTIVTSQLPCQHPQCSVAVRINFDRIEEGPHKLQIHFIDEDGRSILSPVETPLDVVFPADATFLSRNFIVNFQQLKFEAAGLYSIDLAIDNHRLASIPLAVKQSAPAKA